MHWTTAGLAVFSFAAPSACVEVPFSVGATSTILSPILCFIVTLASSMGAYILSSLALQYNCR